MRRGSGICQFRFVLHESCVMCLSEFLQTKPQAGNTLIIDCQLWLWLWLWLGVLIMPVPRVATRQLIHLATASGPSVTLNPQCQILPLTP